jgi:predicted RNA binding protein YcfA (HicA-like mRNA interferase family)
VRPVDWKELVGICKSEGCSFDRERGDHYIMTKPGMSRPVVIPRKSDLSKDIVLGIARTIKLDKKKLKQYLVQKKKAKSTAGDPSWPLQCSVRFLRFLPAFRSGFVSSSFVSAASKSAFETVTSFRIVALNCSNG